MTDTEQLLQQWVAQLRQEEPRAVAILCHGSYARNQAEAHSDLDLDLLIDGEPLVGYRSAFTELPGGRLLHVTIAIMSLEHWLGQFMPQIDSEEWAFFLPARQMARLLWATPEAHARLIGSIVVEIQLSPQLQDVLECVGKVRNAMARADDLGVRLAAQDLALRYPAVLALLNPPLQIETRRQALQAALDLPVAPVGYRAALLTCLGMSGQATSVQDVHAAAVQLVLSLLPMLQAHAAQIGDRFEPGLPEALSDGRVLRLLTQPD